MTAQAHRATSGWSSSRFLRTAGATVALALAIATGCSAPSIGSGDQEDQSGGGDKSLFFPEGNDGGPTVVQCNPIANGSNTVSINGKPRTFNVTLPADTSHMALLFLWHGWMQDPAKFANEIVYDVPAGKWVPFDPNAFPMPLMIVTPTDNKLIPPFGLDWDIVSGAEDFPFFDGMLECLNKQYRVEPKRIYSFGFSAGAVFTNLLSAKYPHLFAATISESGTWFNDQAEWSDVQIPIIQWKWPAFNPGDGGDVLLTHGGPNDFATIISLESANQKALPFLFNQGRTVTECYHTFGHTLEPDLTQANIYQFMWDHELGSPSPNGLTGGFPTPERPVGASSCIFHPPPGR
jgi:predicted esterase